MVIPPRHTLRTLGIALLLAILVHLGILYGVAFSPTPGPASPLAVHLQTVPAVVAPSVKPPSANPHVPVTPAAQAKHTVQQPTHTDAPTAILNAASDKSPVMAAADMTPPPGNPSATPAKTAQTVADAAPGTPPAAGEFLIKQPPRLLKRVEPTYPPQARAQGLEGLVKVRLHIDSSGHPVSPQLVKSSGSALLDNALLAVVPQWQFSPALATTGQPTEADILIPYRFRLQSGNDE